MQDARGGGLEGIPPQNILKTAGIKATSGRSGRADIRRLERLPTGGVAPGSRRAGQPRRSDSQTSWFGRNEPLQAGCAGVFI